MKTIVIGAHKGGTGKTQIALELCYWLASRGKRVLAIDADPQGNLSSVLLDGADVTGRKLAQILQDRDAIKKDDVMSRTIKGTAIDYVVSGISATRLEAKIIGDTPKEYVMGEAIEEIKEAYDYVIIDTPPSAELLSLSSLIAADGLIIPVCPDRHGSEGVASIMALVNRLRSNRRLNPSLSLLGIVVMRYNRNLNNWKYCQSLKSDYGGLVIEPAVRECTKVQQAVTAGLPVLAYDPSCNAAKDLAAAFSTIKL